MKSAAKACISSSDISRSSSTISSECVAMGLLGALRGAEGTCGVSRRDDAAVWPNSVVAVAGCSDSGALRAGSPGVRLGSSTENVEPLPSRLSRVIRPLWSSTSSFDVCKSDAVAVALFASAIGAEILLEYLCLHFVGNADAVVGD